MQSMSFIPALLVVSGLAGCASLHHASAPPDAHERFADAVTRYDYGDLAGAARELAWIREQCAGHEVGQQATLTLAALLLDARNHGSDVDSAAELAETFLRTADPSNWQRPIAATLYLAALDRGAGIQDTATETRTDSARPAAPGRASAPLKNCGPARPLPNAASVPTLPVLPGEPLIARLRAVRVDREQLAATVDSLRTALDSARQELTAKDKELERIRKTLKP